MRLAQAGRIARRELRGGLGAFRIFLTCLTLGVMAIAAVGTVRLSIEDGLSREGAVILGGDAEMEFTYRFASEDQKAWMRSVSDRMSEIVDFRSMAVNAAGERGLTQVKGVDGLYPLLGNVALVPEMPLAEALAGDGTRPGIVMQKVLIDRLGLVPGDTVRLGAKDFVLMAELAREPDAGTSGFSLGPRSIVATPALDGSGLLSEGSLFDTDYRLDLPETADLDAVKAEAEARYRDEGMRWRDARNGAPGIQRFVDRIGAFLVLVGLRKTVRETGTTSILKMTGLNWAVSGFSALSRRRSDPGPWRQRRGEYLMNGWPGRTAPAVGTAKPIWLWTRPPTT